MSDDGGMTSFRSARDAVEDWRFARRVLIVFGVAILLFALGRLAPVLLLAFAAILIAIGMRAFADLLHTYLRVPQNWSLSVAVALVLAAIAGFAYLLGAQVVAQVRGVIEKLPEAAEALGARVGLDVAPEDIRSYWSVDSLSGGLFGRAANYGMVAFGAVANVFLVFAGAIFFASQPALYRDGALLLLPRTARGRVRSAMDATDAALRKWLAGQLVIMVAVAAMAAVAYWMIGLPSWPALALIAGVTNFIPIIGPFVGGAIAVLMASTIDGATMLWTLGAAIVIQEIESILLVPRVQAYAVRVPPAVVIFAMMVFSTLFGLLGLVLALPLAITVMIFVQKLWVRAALGEDVELTGQASAQEE